MLRPNSLRQSASTSGWVCLSCRHQLPPKRHAFHASAAFNSSVGDASSNHSEPSSTSQPSAKSRDHAGDTASAGSTVVSRPPSRRKPGKKGEITSSEIAALRHEMSLLARTVSKLLSATPETATTSDSDATRSVSKTKPTSTGRPPAKVVGPGPHEQSALDNAKAKARMEKKRRKQARETLTKGPEEKVVAITTTREEGTSLKRAMLSLTPARTSYVRYEPLETKKPDSDAKPGTTPKASAKTMRQALADLSPKPTPKASSSSGKGKGAGKGDSGTGVSGSKSTRDEASWVPIRSKDLNLTPLDVDQPPVPSLQYGLDRVLFNPGVYQLQDPRSKVYNFSPYLQQIMPVADFNFDSLKQYKTSSHDEALKEIADEHGNKYIGSTSSMTSTLAHFHFLLSNWRELNFKMLSREMAGELSTTFTKINRAPNAIFLRWKNGTYAIDADKEYDGPNVLMMLGKSMELLLTQPQETYERYRRDSEDKITEQEKSEPESYHYTTLGKFLMRSQLDAYDARLPGTGMFDLKTRAVVSVRMNVEDYETMSGYEIHGVRGKWASFEREHYDLLRGTMLKYMLQARMGRMDGIFLAFHNVNRIFGFQYLSISDMDEGLHGQTDPCLGDQEFTKSVKLLEEVLEMATKKFPEQSLRLHFETQSGSAHDKDVRMVIFAEPVGEAEIERIQSMGKERVAQFEADILGLHQSDASPAEVEASSLSPSDQPPIEREESTENSVSDKEDDEASAFSSSDHTSVEKQESTDVYVADKENDGEQESAASPSPIEPEQGESATEEQTASHDPLDSSQPLVEHDAPAEQEEASSSPVEPEPGENPTEEETDSHASLDTPPTTAESEVPAEQAGALSHETAEIESTETDLSKEPASDDSLESSPEAVESEVFTEQEEVSSSPVESEQGGSATPEQTGVDDLLDSSPPTMVEPEMSVEENEASPPESSASVSEIESTETDPAKEPGTDEAIIATQNIESSSDEAVDVTATNEAPENVPEVDTISQSDTDTSEKESSNAEDVASSDASSELKKPRRPSAAAAKAELMDVLTIKPRSNTTQKTSKHQDVASSNPSPKVTKPRRSSADAADADFLEQLAIERQKEEEELASSPILMATLRIQNSTRKAGDPSALFETCSNNRPMNLTSDTEWRTTYCLQEVEDTPSVLWAQYRDLKQRRREIFVKAGGEELAEFADGDDDDDPSLRRKAWAQTPYIEFLTRLSVEGRKHREKMDEQEKDMVKVSL